MTDTVMAQMHATPGQLVAAREYSRLSTRELAAEVTHELRKDRRKGAMSCSRMTISNLETGKAKRVHHRRAAAIERVLNLPPGYLFRVEVFNVQSHIERIPA